METLFKVSKALDIPVSKLFEDERPGNLLKGEDTAGSYFMGFSGIHILSIMMRAMLIISLPGIVTVVAVSFARFLFS